MDRYVGLVNKCGIKTWLINESVTESVELFFIKRRLDMRRMKKVDSVNISVFKDMEEGGVKLRGRSDCLVNSSMTDEEIIEKIKSAEFSAGFVKNKFFERPNPVTSPEVVAESDLNGRALDDIAKDFVNALYSEDNDGSAFINTFELFVNEVHRAVLSSDGTDVSFVKRKVSGEFVAQCKEPQDVETYQDFEYDTLALNDLKKLVFSTLKLTKDRATASKMPKAGNYDIVLSSKYVPEVMSFYKNRANAGYIYPGYSKFKIGESVQGDDVTGDKINMKFIATVPFNDEGIKMSDREFITDGELKTIHGSERFSFYLGTEQIGTYRKVELPAGKVQLKELLNRKCLHVVNFSDFQMDPLSGYFAGEIRLAYLYDGNGNVECVTGGSINGSLLEAQKDLVFSEEMQTQADYVGPFACLFKNIPVAGEN